MTEPRAFTPAMEAVREIADQALLAGPEGITLYWRCPPFTLETARLQARSFQQSFTSLRARARRLSAEDKLARDHAGTGTYDRLAAQRGDLPDAAGAYIRLCPARALFEDVEIVSNATGQALRTVGSAKHPGWTLLERASDYMLSGQGNALTEAEWDQMTLWWEEIRPPGTTEPWNFLMGSEWYPRGSVRTSQPSAHPVPHPAEEPLTKVDVGPSLTALDEGSLKDLRKSGDVFGEEEPNNGP